MNYYDTNNQIGYINDYLDKLERSKQDQLKTPQPQIKTYDYQNQMKAKYANKEFGIYDEPMKQNQDIQINPNVPKPFPIDLFPIDEGFTKGTIFRNKYIPYKNYQPRRVQPQTEKERMLYEVDKYYFALHEIRMYLDAFPNSREAIEIFNNLQEEYIKAKHAYETRFGPLDIEAPRLDKIPFQWTMSKWPWEGGSQ